MKAAYTSPSRRDYLKQKAEDGSQTEALKRTVVGGETVASEGVTSWIYPGNAVAIILSATDLCKVQMRGEVVAGKGLAKTEYRYLQPTIGVNNPIGTNSGVIRLNIIPHEFRLLDTSGSENKFTWTIIY